MNAHVHWLLTTGRFASDPAALLSGLANRLCEDGLDVIRMNLQPRTLHPEISVMLYVWRPREGRSELRDTAAVVETTRAQHEFGTVQVTALGHTATVPDAFRTSPFHAIQNGASRVRSRLATDADAYTYPIMRDLAAAGATDYVAWPLRLGDGTISYFSLATGKPGGLTDAELEGLESLLDPLAMCIESHLGRHVAQSLLRTYLGTNPGDAVLAGRVRRGDIERVEAAIWFSDLRGFTSASSTLDPAELVAWLNEYFSAMARPVAQHHGEILKFIGDAILAILPVTSESSRGAACEAA
jgi:adenylate cyclase